MFKIKMFFMRKLDLCVCVLVYVCVCMCVFGIQVGGGYLEEEDQ